MIDGPQYDPNQGANRTDYRDPRGPILGGAATGRIPHAPPPNRLNVSGALNTVDENLNELHKTISELENHIQLVLGAPPPSSAEVAKHVDSPQVVDRIMRQNDVINGCRFRLNGLMERLQL